MRFGPLIGRVLIGQAAPDRRLGRATTLIGRRWIHPTDRRGVRTCRVRPRVGRAGWTQQRGRRWGRRKARRTGTGRCRWWRHVGGRWWPACWWTQCRWTYRWAHRWSCRWYRPRLRRGRHLPRWCGSRRWRRRRCRRRHGRSGPRWWWRDVHGRGAADRRPARTAAADPTTDPTIAAVPGTVVGARCRRHIGFRLAPPTTGRCCLLAGRLQRRFLRGAPACRAPTGHLGAGRSCRAVGVLPWPEQAMAREDIVDRLVLHATSSGRPTCVGAGTGTSRSPPRPADRPRVYGDQRAGPEPG